MIRKQGQFSQAHEWVPDSLVHSGCLGGKYLCCSPLPRMVKKTEKSKRSGMIKLWWYLSVCMAYDLEKIVWKGLLFSGEIQFYSAAKEEPMNHLKHLLLCLYSSVNIWFLPNQQLVHTSPSCILLWSSWAFWGELFSVPALMVSPNWPKPNICPFNWFRDELWPSSKPVFKHSPGQLPSVMIWMFVSPLPPDSYAEVLPLSVMIFGGTAFVR